MTATLRDCVEHNGFVLAASDGDTPYDTHSYYVRPDFSGPAAGVRAIRETDDTGHEAGRGALDLAAPCRSGGG